MLSVFAHSVHHRSRSIPSHPIIITTAQHHTTSYFVTGSIGPQIPRTQGKTAQNMKSKSDIYYSTNPTKTSGVRPGLPTTVRNRTSYLPLIAPPPCPSSPNSPPALPAPAAPTSSTARSSAAPGTRCRSSSRPSPRAPSPSSRRGPPVRRATPARTRYPTSSRRTRTARCPRCATTTPSRSRPRCGYRKRRRRR